MTPILCAFLLSSDPQLAQFVHKQQFEQAIKRAFLLNEDDSFDAPAAEKLASSLIEKGLNSSKTEETLLSLHAAMICEKDLDIAKLTYLFSLNIPFVQHMILKHLEKIELNTSYPILKNALSGGDLGVRLHACQILAHSGHKEGLAQLESLMYRLPRELRYVFAGLFAEIGSKEAQIHLKTLLEDSLWTNRVAALLAVAEFKQDGLLSYIKSSLSHTQPAEIEAAAYGLGILQDLGALPKLEKLLSHNAHDVKLAAALALSRLGVEQGRAFIIEEAKKLDQFAINLLPELNLIKEDLSFLFDKHDINHRINATIVLLKKRHPAGLLEAYSLLKDLPPILPRYSSGRTLVSYKMEKKQDTLEYAIAFRKYFATMLIHEMFSYSPQEADPHFINLLSHKELIPIIVRGLLDRGDEKAIKLLKQLSETPGNPYLRTQANLQLFLKKPSLHTKNKLMEYLNVVAKDELIRFSNSTKSQHRFSELFLEPTPEERSELFINCAAALCMHKDKSVINLFLKLLKDGHISNRPLIAAFLILSLS